MSEKIRMRPHHASSAMDVLDVLQRSRRRVDRQALRQDALKLVSKTERKKFLDGLPPEGEKYFPKTAITLELKKIIRDNNYRWNFEQAIKTVSEQNILELDKIKTLYQFYYYLDQLVKWIPEIRHWEWYGETFHERTVYLRITQFYYYFNQPELVALQSPIAPEKTLKKHEPVHKTKQKLSPISQWMHQFSLAWGDFLDTKESIDPERLETFKYAPEYALQDFKTPPTGYKSFNAFFAREFEDIKKQRPVAQEENDRVIVFPAESTYVGQWRISTDVGPPLAAPPSIFVNHIEWPIEERLEDTSYNKIFEGGLFCHTFLNTYDYHRLHTPVRGWVKEAKFIPGQVYLEVHLKEQEGEPADGQLAKAVVPQRYLGAEDATGYQFVQCRGLLVIESPIGHVAIWSMGMAHVSSVVFVEPKTHDPILPTKEEREAFLKYENYDHYVELLKPLNDRIHDALVGKYVEKGEMFSYFQFGGSDFVMVFERDANVDITAEVGIHYPIRSQFGVSNINKFVPIKKP